MEPCQITSRWTAASTSSAWPSTRTLRQILAIRPSAPIRTVVRMNSHEGPAIHGFFAPGAIGLQHLMLLIRNKRNRRADACPGTTSCALTGRPRRQAPRFRFGESARQPGEVDCLPGAAGRVGAGIEKQHQFLARHSRPARRCRRHRGADWKAGALAPSTSVRRLAAGGFGARPIGWILTVSDAAACATRWPLAAAAGFDCLCRFGDALATVVCGFAASSWPTSCRSCRGRSLPVLLGAACLCARASCGLGDSLEDFLRVFLDIRLPFVAFRRSTIRVLRVLSWPSDSLRLLGKFDDLGVWLQGIRRTTRPLVDGTAQSVLGPDHE